MKFEKLVLKEGFHAFGQIVKPFFLTFIKYKHYLTRCSTIQNCLYGKSSGSSFVTLYLPYKIACLPQKQMKTIPRNVCGVQTIN
jgi:hypothetical protein